DLRPESDTRLHIATIQGMIKRILYPSDEAQPVPVDWYDCVIIDECHRGYNLDQEMSDAALQFRSESDYISTYRRVLDHFDAVRIGLTATPALHTTEILTLVANCPALPGTSDFMRPTSMEERGFYEFATSVNI